MIRLPSYYTDKSNYIVTLEEWNNRCKWEHLTAKEQKQICDGGCGINIYGIKIIPDFIFGDSCCHHDFAWFRGGDERVRKIVERAFYYDVQRNMIKYDAKYYYNFWATAYTNTTNKLGWLKWNYGPMKSKEEILDLAFDRKHNIKRLER